jgi:hypothetical protein
MTTVKDIVARQKAVARAEQSAEKLRRLLAEPPASRKCSPGETAEQRHWLYDDDPDSAVSAFPYPTSGGAQ